MRKKILIHYFFFEVFLLLFVPQILKAGSFGEHKLIGDSAFKQYCRDNPAFANRLQLLLGFGPLDPASKLIPIDSPNATFYKRSLYYGQYPLDTLGGKALTYGDFTALSGDHCPDFIEMFRRFFNGGDGDFKSSGLYQALFNDIICQYKKQLANLNSGKRGKNFLHWDFDKLAFQDKSHFHIPATTQRQEIEFVGLRAYYNAGKLLHSATSQDHLAIINNERTMDSFESNSTAKYTILHAMAKLYYLNVLESLEMNDQDLAMKFLRLTLFANAFSDHYLQDMFAAGHFLTDRRAPDDLLGLEAKGIHDFFGSRGLTTFIESDTITLKGDADYTDRQIQLAVAANYVSLSDIFNERVIPDIGEELRRYEYNYLRMLETPTQEPSDLFPALKKVPDNPVGINYSSQRNVIGKSLSGIWYGVHGLGYNDFAGTGISGGFNYLIKSPKGKYCLEEYAGAGINITAEVVSDLRNGVVQHSKGRLGIGIHGLFFDYLYAAASITTGIPRYEQAIQIKPLKWRFGFRIGVVEYPSFSMPHLSFSIIQF